MDWRIYYCDGSTFDSDQGEPAEAPAFGVLAIVQRDSTPEPANVGRFVRNGWDWYYWQPEAREWWAGDLFGLLDRLLHCLPVGPVKQGRTTSQTVYRETMSRAHSDQDFPPKSARHFKENEDIV